MARHRQDATIFLVAALWNFAAAGSLWIAGLTAPGVFGMFGMTPPPDLFYFNATMGFVVAFGVGYLVVSGDTSRNHGVVLIGVIAKSVIVLDTIVAVARQEASAAVLGFGLVDLIFVVLFVDFLRRSGRGARARAG